MNFSSVLNAATVWSNPTRTITSLNGAITRTTADNQTLANGSTAIFGGGAAANAESTVVGLALTNVTWQLGVVTLAVFRIGIVGAAAAIIMGSGVGGANLGFAINNGGTVNGTYSVISILWQ